MYISDFTVIKTAGGFTVVCPENICTIAELEKLNVSELTAKINFSDSKEDGCVTGLVESKSIS